VGLFGIGLAAFSRWQEQTEIVLGTRPSIERKLERLIRSEGARSYIVFSQWIGLGFPVVNNTGVVWSSRFDSMWALVGEFWRQRIDRDVTREWPVHRWVVQDFLAACPDLAVVDDRDGVDYVGILSSFDPRFKTAWSDYQQIAALGRLRVFRRQAEGPSVTGMRCTRASRATIAP
jgi:hypothetical protein